MLSLDDSPVCRVRFHGRCVILVRPYVPHALIDALLLACTVVRYGPILAFVLVYIHSLPILR